MTPTTNRNTVVLAFDIERSGATAKYDTIAIGGSVLDWTFKELESLSLLGYIPKETVFEPRCWEEFWVKRQDALDALIYKGDKKKKAREKEMIREFQAFRRKWETKTRKGHCELELVTDNNVYDGGFINNMLFEHTDSLPIPYSSDGQYSPFWETHSQQRGLLMAVDPSFKQNWGLSERILELYDVPVAMKKAHDHNPANDAYTIAFDQQVLLHIRDGQIKRRE